VSVYRLISAERASTPVSYVLPAARGEPLELLRLGLSERNCSSEVETVLRNMHSELRLRASGGAGDLQARDAAAELGEHGLGLEAELLEQAGVALGIDLAGQLLLGHVDLVRLALLMEQVEELALGDFRRVPFALTADWLLRDGPWLDHG
jgi:hypothetical protein